MPTTTNYGWTTPADTDLVKDGASAIRTLGSSADTTVKNLNPETTLGDLAYRSSTANVKTRLALGTAGQVLQVNSGANAPEWATPSSGGMTLISTTTLTGSSVNLTSIPQIYNNLQLVFRDTTTSDEGPLAMRFNSSSNAVYKSDMALGASANVVVNYNEIYLNGAMDASVTNNLAIINIYDYANAVTNKIGDFRQINTNPTTTSNFNTTFQYFVATEQAAISSILIFPITGTMSGTALLYGVK